MASRLSIHKCVGVPFLPFLLLSYYDGYDSDDDNDDEYTNLLYPVIPALSIHILYTHLNHYTISLTAVK